MKEDYTGILEEEYKVALSKSSDINEHIPTLYKYAKNCTSIVECGVRTCVSTWAFLKGLKDNSTETEKMFVMNDLNNCDRIQKALKLGNNLGIKTFFIQGSDLEAPFPERDLLFIDTWHVYPQLRDELHRLHSLTKKYIIMHDTTTFGINGEPVYGSNSKYDKESLKKGLWPAVEEFLLKNPQWKVLERYTNNNGLTILSKN